jgi:hypothetical protein
MPTSLGTQKKAYQEGQQAYLAGLDKHTYNPYQTNSYDWLDWRDGWEDTYQSEEDKREEAHEAGREAARRGRDKWRNPHPAGSRLHAAWENGYEFACDEMAEEEEDS